MRIQFIDALRGVASLAVVLYHYNNRLDWTAFSYGNLGVAVFFVLSGFVIAMSVGQTSISSNYLGRFALRRALRLDPPYWLTIAAVVVAGYLLQGQVKFHGVSAPQVLAHMFYLQDALSYQSILPVFWTLCYEIQFYLALILLMWLMQRACWRPYILVSVILLLSLFDRHYSITHPAFMGRFWFCFALGALLYWTHVKRMGLALFVAVWTTVACFGVIRSDGYAIAAATTAAAIYIALAARRPDLLAGTAWQFLGRISYSLYLTHLLFGWLAMRLMDRYLPALPAAAIGVAVALVSAWIFYLLAEKPAVALSHRVGVPRD